MPKDNKDFFKEKKVWSTIKDNLLGCYLVPYFAKILSMGNPVLYVDCFAGKGKFDDGNPGSPIIALNSLQKSLNVSKHPSIPKVNMSLMNTFEYKNFTLSVFLTAQLGQTHLNALYDTSHNSYRQNRFLVDFWTPENPTNGYPKNSLNSDVKENIHKWHLSYSFFG